MKFWFYKSKQFVILFRRLEFGEEKMDIFLFFSTTTTKTFPEV